MLVDFGLAGIHIAVTIAVNQVIGDAVVWRDLDHVDPSRYSVFFDTAVVTADDLDIVRWCLVGV